MPGVYSPRHCCERSSESLDDQFSLRQLPVTMGVSFKVIAVG